MSFEAVVNILDELTPGARVGICAHTRPDGDAVGAVLGLRSVLATNGIEAYALLADESTAPKTYAWLEGFEAYLRPSQAPHDFDYLFVLDTPTMQRLALGEKYLKVARDVVLIDHHARGDVPVSVGVVDTTAAATCQLIWKLISASRFEVTKTLAETCLLGLMTDTGSFNHTNTSATALRDAADMVEAGADPTKIANCLYHSKTSAALELEQRVLSRIQIHDEGQISTSFVTARDFSETGALRSEGENLVELVRSLAGIKVAILFTRNDDSVRISLRSKTNVDVASVAREIGGGGHKAAAGCTWPNNDDDFDDIMARVIAMVAQQIAETPEDDN